MKENNKIPNEFSEKPDFEKKVFPSKKMIKNQPERLLFFFRL